MTDESPLSLAQADSITQYTDQAAWTAALTAGSTTQVETFDNNQINTALQISSCQTLNGGCLPGASAISAIVTGQFTDAVGRLAYNPANGQFAFYNATTFLLPGASYAVGFDVSETPIASAIPTDISVTVNSTAFYPL